MDRQKKQAAKPQPKASFPGKVWTKTQRCRQVLETRVPYWQEGEVRPGNKEKENIQNERRQIEQRAEGKGERERKKKVSLIIPTEPVALQPSSQHTLPLTSTRLPHAADTSSPQPSIQPNLLHPFPNLG
jgi:hypothetical protein